MFLVTAVVAQNMATVPYAGAVPFLEASTALSPVVRGQGDRAARKAAVVPELAGYRCDLDICYNDAAASKQALWTGTMCSWNQCNGCCECSRADPKVLPCEVPKLIDSPSKACVLLGDGYLINYNGEHLCEYYEGSTTDDLPSSTTRQ